MLRTETGLRPAAARALEFRQTSTDTSGGGRGEIWNAVLTPTGGQTGAVCSPAFRADDLFIRRQLVSALSPADTPPLSVRL